MNTVEELATKGKDAVIANLLITLLTGSINDAKRVGIETPTNILEAIKQRIIMLDADQNRFIYDTHSKKRIAIQGLAGTGKTELLLHKLYELYMSDENSKVVFTCFNKVLANEMREKRVPDFFDFMRADKQIEWKKRLWVMRSWGSQLDANSGVYSYICHAYGFDFSPYRSGISFGGLCRDLAEKLKGLETFSPCFDYVLIDEGQDFDEDFFRLCELVSAKQVIIASDIFQNIFSKESQVMTHPDFTLNKVYRTDPKNFMFAQLLGFGVEERPVINWLDDATWKACGYDFETDEDGAVYKFTRSPLRRFDNLKDVKSEPLLIYRKDDMNEKVLEVIQKIIESNPRVTPDDIGIVFLGTSNKTYNMIDRLSIQIQNKFTWETQKAYEVKSKSPGSLFISNRNNIKGLEFPFLICVADSPISLNLGMRNSMYMALTRSFITSYLITSSVNEELMSKYDNLYKQIMDTGVATVRKPNSEDIMDASSKLLQQKDLTQRQVVDKILKQKGVLDREKQNTLARVVNAIEKDRVDPDSIKRIIESNLESLQ